MDIRIYSFTKKGSQLNRILRDAFLGAGVSCEGYTVQRFAGELELRPVGDQIQRQIGEIWGETALIFIGAVGIAVRMIAPWVRDKYTDSAVVVLDEEGRYVIPLLSGHLGGAAALAKSVAGITKGTVVLTAATDVQGKFAVDLFAAKNHLRIQDRRAAKQISAAVLEGKRIGLYSKTPVCGTRPENVYICERIEELAAFSHKVVVNGDALLCKEAQEAAGNLDNVCLELFSQDVAVGIGCRKGTSKEIIQEELEKILTEFGIDRGRLQAFVSIDLKRNEAGILETAKEYGVPFFTFSPEELRAVEEVSSHSDFVEQVTGVDNVCERAVKRFYPDGKLLFPKTCRGKVTFAAARGGKKIVF